MNDLDTILHAALSADAEHAPQLPDEWVGPTTAVVVPLAPRPGTRRAMAVVGAVAATAAAVGGLALVARPVATPAPAASTAPAPPAWQPPGDEFPVIDLGAGTQSALGPTVAAMTRSVGVEGHPPIQLTTSLTYQGGVTADLVVCAAEEYSSGCRDGSPQSAVTWSIYVTSSVENKVSLTTDLWVLEGVAPGTAFISYIDGDVRLWQRPIAGLVVFPDVAGRDEVAIAHDAVGTELARYTLADLGPIVETVEVPPQADLTVAEFDAISDLTRDSMADCLAAAGGTSTTGEVYHFAEDVDQLAVWADCVATTQSAIADAIAEIGPQFFDPLTQTPLAEPSAYAPG